jgi:hypothetical protein
MCAPLSRGSPARGAIIRAPRSRAARGVVEPPNKGIRLFDRRRRIC